MTSMTNIVGSSDNNNICFCRSNLQTNSILGIIGISLLSRHRGRSESHHCGPEAAAERHGGDLVVPVGLGHAGVAEAGEVIAAAAPGAAGTISVARDAIRRAAGPFARDHPEAALAWWEWQDGSTPFF